MKRTSLKRKAPLTQGKPVRKRNSKRAAAKFERNYGARGAAVRELACLVKSKRTRSPGGLMAVCLGDIVAAHTRARGMGGCKGDRRELVPLCDFHHRVAGEARTSDRASFEGSFGLDLYAEAARVAAELDARGIP